MAVTRKPKTTEDKITDLINKGGGIAQVGPEPKDSKTGNVLLRMPAAILAQVDAAVAARPYYTARTTWLMEAVMEKLAKEGF